jgi:hypothetical protein
LNKRKIKKAIDKITNRRKNGAKRKITPKEERYARKTLGRKFKDVNVEKWMNSIQEKINYFNDILNKY